MSDNQEEVKQVHIVEHQTSMEDRILDKLDYLNNSVNEIKVIQATQAETLAGQDLVLNDIKTTIAPVVTRNTKLTGIIDSAKWVVGLVIFGYYTIQLYQKFM